MPFGKIFTVGGFAGRDDAVADTGVLQDLLRRFYPPAADEQFPDEHSASSTATVTYTSRGVVERGCRIRGLWCPGLHSRISRRTRIEKKNGTHGVRARSFRRRQM